MDPATCAPVASVKQHSEDGESIGALASAWCPRSSLLGERYHGAPTARHTRMRRALS